MLIGQFNNFGMFLIFPSFLKKETRKDMHFAGWAQGWEKGGDRKAIWRRKAKGEELPTRFDCWSWERAEEGDEEDEQDQAEEKEPGEAIHQVRQLQPPSSHQVRHCRRVRPGRLGAQASGHGGQARQSWA